jgi:hypothetical protein
MEMLLHGNALLALAAAVLWGGGDFSGGMSVKNAGGTMDAALRVILLSHAVSFAILLATAWWRGDAFPHGAPLMWGLVAGVTAGIALACFYVALSRGAMGASAALSGLLAAGIPAAVSVGSEGSPGLLRLVGFVVAGVAIWLIAAGPNTEASPADRGTIWLAVVAGVGFGIYFVALKFAGSAGVFWPLATARSWRDVSVGEGWDDWLSVYAGGGCVGYGWSAAGYIGESAVYCGYAGGAAGCGGGAGFALSGFDDFAGCVDAAGAAYAAARCRDGRGCCCSGDDYGLGVAPIRWNGGGSDLPRKKGKNIKHDDARERKKHQQCECRWESCLFEYFPKGNNYEHCKHTKDEQMDGIKQI